jgi:hypothetical protein
LNFILNLNKVACRKIMSKKTLFLISCFIAFSLSSHPLLHIGEDLNEDQFPTECQVCKTYESVLALEEIEIEVQNFNEKVFLTHDESIENNILQNYLLRAPPLS